MTCTTMLLLSGLFLLQSLTVVTVNGDCADILGECTKDCGGGVFELDDQVPCNVHSCDPTTDCTPIGKDIVVAIDMATTFGEKAYCIARSYVLNILHAYKSLVSAAVAKDTNLSFMTFDKAANLWIPLGRLTLDSLDAFENEFKEINHTPQLKGSMEVSALIGARVTFQADSDLRRPRVLMILADGVTNQGSLLDDTSKLLIDEGINMIVVGIPGKKFDLKNLLRMANGEQDFVFDATDLSNAPTVVADVVEALSQIQVSPLSCEVTSETDCKCDTGSLLENIECTYLGQQHNQFVTKHCSCSVSKNNLLKMPKVTCSASSVWGTGFECERAYDGLTEYRPYQVWLSDREGDGTWIQFDFPRTGFVQAVRIWPACNMLNQYQRYVLTFSDGTTQELTASCYEPSGGVTCPNVPVIYQELTEVETSSIRVTGHDVCDSSRGTGGLREIEVYGEML